MRRQLAHLREAYAPHEHRPLSGYLRAMTVHAAVTGAVIAYVKATGHPVPKRPAPQDVLLLSIGTHKLSRMLSKAAVASPLRAPFTRYERPAGSGEVMEQVRAEGSSTRHAIGELLSCPFCLGVWVATGLTCGLVLAPRLTRLVTTALTAIATSDFLQMAYAVAQQAAEGRYIPVAAQQHAG